MTKTVYRYKPDYVVPPGRILKERLAAQGISQAEFARRCGRSPKLISEIIAGKAPLEPKTAVQFELVLGVDAGIWLGIESKYQLFHAREAMTADAKGSNQWIKAFPVNELVKRGCFSRPKSDSEAALKLLSFFRVGSLTAWHGRFDRLNAAYRHSPSFKSNNSSLAAWLQLGEIAADRLQCGNYSQSRFREAIHSIRGTTRKPIQEAWREAVRQCSQSGVSLVFVRSLPKTALSGAAWWPMPGRPVIQLTARHKSDDHLWFSFFHEAAHILLHGKRGVFVDGSMQGDSDTEIEANGWASNVLVPRSAWDEFASMVSHGECDIRLFADKHEISPGIVVGMLQHQGRLNWNQLNHLKVRVEFDDLEETPA